MMTLVMLAAREPRIVRLFVLRQYGQSCEPYVASPFLIRGLLTSTEISRSLEPHAGQASTLSPSHKCMQWPHISDVNSCCSPSQRMPSSSGKTKCTVGS